MMAPSRFSFVVLVSAFLAARATDAAQQSAAFTCHAVKMLTRDGTKLHTQIYQPTAPGVYPVILIRNPYAFGSTYSNGCTQGFDWVATRWAEKGYVAVLQEVRGTGKSEGIFVPFLQEQQDGYDAIEWAATQPWSNGKVATTSMSYLGATQWQAAITSPPHLVAISPAITGADYHDDWIFRNGVPDLLFAINWGLGFAPEMFTHQLRRQGVPDGQIVRQSVALNGTLVRGPGDWLSMLPLSRAWSSKAERLTPFVFEWLKHSTYDSYWSSIDVMVSATQTIFHDPTHPSKLVLSVAPGIATIQ
jgi:uncharacterized protein